ncbi:putative RNA-binding motif protein, single-stranded-interacting protein 3 [Trichinella spiralis]|uniref:putative RNA-binding motif protein, single-stranded-interacting protein 3 n=2 Tax=Trichinella spiralis TaxID=6334 RepID=UPI0001EFD9E0|nr:putative RNA-binding motif protein, single-stranded-interacting protein 3 [Trichinella spiralis]
MPKVVREEFLNMNNVNCRRNTQRLENENHNLYITGFKALPSLGFVKNFLLPYGNVLSCRILVKQSRNFGALAEMESVDQCYAAVQNLHGKTFPRCGIHYPISVQFARYPGPFQTTGKIGQDYSYNPTRIKETRRLNDVSRNLQFNREVPTVTNTEQILALAHEEEVPALTYENETPKKSEVSPEIVGSILALEMRYVKIVEKLKRAMKRMDAVENMQVQLENHILNYEMKLKEASNNRDKNTLEHAKSDAEKNDHSHRPENNNTRETSKENLNYMDIDDIFGSSEANNRLLPPPLKPEPLH